MQFLRACNDERGNFTTARAETALRDVWATEKRLLQDGAITGFRLRVAECLLWSTTFSFGHQADSPEGIVFRWGLSNCQSEVLTFAAFDLALVGAVYLDDYTLYPSIQKEVHHAHQTPRRPRHALPF